MESIRRILHSYALSTSAGILSMGYPNADRYPSPNNPKRKDFSYLYYHLLTLASE